MTTKISRAVVAAAAAAAMIATPTLTAPAHAAPMPAAGAVVAKPGSTGAAVKQIQGRLHGLGYYRNLAIDGIYGARTADAVKRFQTAHKLPATGIVDTTTNNLIATKYRARKAAPKPAPKPVASKVVAKPGDRNNTVKQIQGRLSGLGYLPTSSIIGVYGPATTSAVKRFQANSGLKATGIVDTTTNNTLVTKYRNRSKAPAKPRVRLDSRCLTGRAICIDKGDRKMYWVVNGSVKATYQVRTGRASLPTRSGSFKVYLKHPNWYSTLYHVNMPYTMFFSGGQAVHYSSEFARIGYSGAGSHGCVNMNSRSDAKWLYSQARVGDKVIVTA